MDYLGESGIGAWQYGTPNRQHGGWNDQGMMSNTAMMDKMFTGMANGEDMMADMAQEQQPIRARRPMMAVLSMGIRGTLRPAAISI